MNLTYSPSTGVLTITAREKIKVSLSELQSPSGLMPLVEDLSRRIEPAEAATVISKICAFKKWRKPFRSSAAA